MDDLKRRVQKRFARTSLAHDFSTDSALGVLRAKPAHEGVELTLLDFDAARERALRERVATLSEPRALNLEELFLDLTAQRDAQVA